MTRYDPRTGRFTAERTTTTVTERLTVEPPAAVVPCADAAPVFAGLLRDPPEGARWAHPGFLADMADRARRRAPAET